MFQILNTKQIKIKIISLKWLYNAFIINKCQNNKQKNLFNILR